MQNTKKEKGLSKEKEQAIEKLFAAKAVQKKVPAKKTLKKVTTENQEKSVKMVTKEKIGSDGIFSGEKNGSKSERQKPENVSEKRFRRIFKKIVAVVALIFLIAGLSWVFYFYHLNKKNTAQQAAPQKSLQEIKKRIGVFMELPVDEEPILTTVNEAERVNGQKFFSKAQNGDDVLNYVKNKEVILYRWSSNKIIEVSNQVEFEDVKNVVANLQTIDDSRAAQTEQAVSVSASARSELQVANVKVAVFNGSKIAGLAKKIASSIAEIPGVEIGKIANAKKNYAKTLVVDLSGMNEEIAGKIGETIGGEIGQLPAGEIQSDADIVVIGGEN